MVEVNGVHTAQQQSSATAAEQCDGRSANAALIHGLSAEMVHIEEHPVALGQQASDISQKMDRKRAEFQAGGGKLRALTNDLDERFKRLTVLTENAKSAGRALRTRCAATRRLCPRPPNRGEKEVTVRTTEGHSCMLKIHATDMQKPTVSMPRICNTGDEVVLTRTGGNIQHKEAGQTFLPPKDNDSRAQVEALPLSKVCFARQGI